MIVGIVGGRDFSDKKLFWATVKDMKITKIVSGGADGADDMAYQYARKIGIPFACFPPLKNEKELMGFSRAAKRRNMRIVEVSEFILAFPTKQSKGTWHTVNLARRLGKEVRVVESD